MITIYLDESGYTGVDLYHPEQRIFALALLKTDETEAITLKTRYFSGVHSTELKHNKMVRYPKQQNMIVEYLNGIDSDKILYSYFHKRYVLVSKIIDFFVEPYFYNAGVEFYEKGMHIVFSLLFYQCLVRKENETVGEKLMKAFQELMIKPDEKKIKMFYICISAIKYRRGDPNIFEFVEYFNANKKNDKYSLNNALDLAFTGAYSLISRFPNKKIEYIKLIHDESSNMSKRKDFWNKLVGPDVPGKIFGEGRNRVKFPINVGETIFGNSKEIIGLQLVEILVGALTHYVKWQYNIVSKNNEYALKLHGVLRNKNYSVFPLGPDPRLYFDEEGKISSGIGKDSNKLIDFTISNVVKD